MSAETWIDGPTARDLMGLPDVRAVNRLVDEGLIQKRTLANVRARYRRSDCEALIRNQLASPTEAAPCP